ncbi:hypothetical protein C8R48DRAFT_676437 [Suillus tomentosus]|nr:hypothetical protein C8R48DRAFT_676437 [Suillus tomentosus]
MSEVMRDNVGVLAFDARRHGKTTSSQSDEDLPINVLFADFCALLQTIYPDAAEAPNLMKRCLTILNSRPEGFDSVEEAIEWHINTGLNHNPTSARVSIPSIVAPADSALTPNTRANIGFKYKWRTPLRSTAPYWDSWFPSLSPLFLGLSSARLLVLAVMAGLGVGHLVHENDPTKLAEILAEIWRCNERIVVRGNVIKAVGEV